MDAPEVPEVIDTVCVEEYVPATGLNWGALTTPAEAFSTAITRPPTRTYSRERVCAPIETASAM
jgi:hypothetical protein